MVHIKYLPIYVVTTWAENHNVCIPCVTSGKHMYIVLSPFSLTFNDCDNFMQIHEDS